MGIRKRVRHSGGDEKRRKQAGRAQLKRGEYRRDPPPIQEPSETDQHQELQEHARGKCCPIYSEADDSGGDEERHKGGDKQRPHEPEERPESMHLLVISNLRLRKHLIRTGGKPRYMVGRWGLAIREFRSPVARWMQSLYQRQSLPKLYP